MRFHIKVIIAFAFVTITVFFYLNSMFFNFIDYFKEDYLLHYLQQNRINREFIENKIYEYTKQVILWEFLLILVTMLILYKIIDRMSKQEREYKDFLELLLLTISHKFGNFLASQKGNIEILKIKRDEMALQRLEKNYELIKDDLSTILSYIENFKKFSSEKERVSVMEILNKCIDILSEKKSFKISGKDVYVYSNKQIFENIIFPLIENAGKYSEGIVYIRVTRRYLAIRNKILVLSRGTGIGLKISETLASKQGFQLLHRTKGEYFICQLKFR